MAGGLSDLLTRLGQKPRGKGRLGPAPSRDALGVSRAEALPAAGESSTGTGLVSPLTEQGPATGATIYSLYSSNGLLVVQYDSATEWTDFVGTSMVFQHKDPNA